MEVAISQPDKQALEEVREAGAAGQALLRTDSSHCSPDAIHQLTTNIQGSHTIRVMTLFNDAVRRVAMAEGAVGEC